MATLGLKIDVDTYWGMRNGVPRILQVLREYKVQGTFFLSIGPDNSGRAALQLIKNPLFLKKMMRTKAASLYGWRTALYGTLLPAPMIALSFPNLVRKIMDEGHEVQFHAWDHRRWQDELPKKSKNWIEDWFAKGITGFEKLTGKNPTAFGAPSWLIDERVLEVIRKYRFDYLSCTRARMPFVHLPVDIVEVPSDLPCFEELPEDQDVTTLCRLISDGRDHVLPVHAEVEGGIFEVKFRELLDRIISENVEISGLYTLKERMNMDDLPKRRHQMTLLPGRHSSCAV